MGVITISLRDETERKLRMLARARYSKQKKGQLSAAITEAVENWAGKDKNEVILKTLELLDEGIDMGGFITKDRAKWHER